MRRAMVIAGSAAAVAWWRMFTPWQRGWVATDSERAMTVPVGLVTFVMTRRLLREIRRSAERATA